MSKEGAMTKSCPDCREPLAAITVAGVAVDGCQGCGGVWFDRGELTRLAQGDLTQLAAIDRAFEGAAGSGAPAVEGSPCPVCGTRLAPFQPPQTPQLSLTGCPAGHGTWLREDDFESIIAQVEQWRTQQRGTPGGTPAPARQRLRDVAHVLLSQPCPNCRQPNAAASPVCWACGTVLQSSQARFCCPTCGCGLDSFVYEGLLLNHCGACGSLWLDRGELGALLQIAEALLLQLQSRLEPASAVVVPQVPALARCPACHRDMRYHEYGLGSGVFIHTCGSCQGVWIDYAALVPIQRFVQYNEGYLAPPESS
jgi:Zn-finger nucleic acid-binding protein